MVKSMPERRVNNNNNNKRKNKENVITEKMKEKASSKLMNTFKYFNSIYLKIYNNKKI